MVFDFRPPRLLLELYPIIDAKLRPLRLKPVYRYIWPIDTLSAIGSEEAVIRQFDQVT